MAGVSFMPRFMISASTEQSVTWNSADKDTSITLSNGDRDASCVDSSFSAVRATLGRSTGKYYFEISMPTVPTSARCGIANGSFTLTTYVGNAANSTGVTGGAVTNNGHTVNTAITPPANSDGVYYMYALDLDNDYAWLGRNNSWLGSGNPAAGTNMWLTAVTGTIYPACSLYNNGSFRLHAKTSEIQGTLPSGFSVWAAA